MDVIVSQISQRLAFLAPKIGALMHGPRRATAGPAASAFQGNEPMQNLHVSIANIMHFESIVEPYMSATKYNLSHAHKGIFAMNIRPNNTSMAPHSVLISALSDIIAPIAYAISAALVATFSRAKKRGENAPAKPAAIHAPHVAVVMVPGKFVTDPFTHR